MSIIPGKVYTLIEKRLRQRCTAMPRALRALESARDRATEIGSPGIGGSMGNKSKPASSRVEKAAILVASAEEYVQELEKWEDVFKQVDSYFPPDKSSEGFVASLMYGNGMSQEDVCRFTNCARQTVRRQRDRYINYIALLAARRGLIREEDMVADGQADPEK